jgi:hypothetical protein
MRSEQQGAEDGKVARRTISGQSIGVSKLRPRSAAMWCRSWRAFPFEEMCRSSRASVVNGDRPVVG